MSNTKQGNPTFRRFLDSEVSGGIVLMGVAALAILTANSPPAPAYFDALHAYLGPLSFLHWINDTLMAVFFLMVGLEIKREMTDGQLSTWPRRILPGVAAIGGMAVPALIYVAFMRAILPRCVAGRSRRPLTSLSRLACSRCWGHGFRPR